MKIKFTKHEEGKILLDEIEQLIVYDKFNQPVLGIAKTDQEGVYKIAVCGDPGFKKLLNELGENPVPNTTRIKEKI